MKGNIVCYLIVLSFLEWPDTFIDQSRLNTWYYNLDVRVMSIQNNNPCGWFGSIQTFLSTPKQDWLAALQEHHQLCMNCAADESQKSAWEHEFDILQKELKRLVQIKPAIAEYAIIFEYELPRERGRRPDVVILGPCVFVFEFKDYAKLLAAHSDQVAAYARDLKHYHAASHHQSVLPILVLARSKDLIQHDEDVLVISPDHIEDVFDVEVELENSPLIDPQHWITAEYAPLPSLIQAARMLWDDKTQLPQLKRANSAGIPQTIAALFTIAERAKQNNGLHLALVTGVPGAGKTLVGIRLVYENHLQELNKLNNAVFLSGNGPLVEVLRDALKNKFFIQDVFAFLKQYGGDKKGLPHEHIWVFDEAQRAWDAEKVEFSSRGHAISEPEDFLKLAERTDSWVLLVALIGEGQEIHTGEESGLQQWNAALLKMQKRWIIHTPQKISSYFSPTFQVETNNVLDLTKTLRSHIAEKVTQWVEELLKGDLQSARKLVEDLYSQGFDLYLTNDLEVAKNYVRERYRGEEDKRFGLLASSGATNLNAWNIPNDFLSTRKMKKPRWYNDPPGSERSCCSFHDVATEFACQGLELDFPIICWGNDLIWNNSWQSKFSKKTDIDKVKPVSKVKSKSPKKKIEAKDPHQLRVNSYRVLLTRGRDGFFIFVPNEIGMRSTYEALKGAGIRELANINEVSVKIETGRIIENL
jgi:DUF2075 family protein